MLHFLLLADFRMEAGLPFPDLLTCVLANRRSISDAHQSPDRSRTGVRTDVRGGTNGEGATTCFRPTPPGHLHAGSRACVGRFDDGRSYCADGEHVGILKRLDDHVDHPDFVTFGL